MSENIWLSYLAITCLVALGTTTIDTIKTADSNFTRLPTGSTIDSFALAITIIGLMVLGLSAYIEARQLNDHIHTSFIRADNAGIQTPLNSTPAELQEAETQRIPHISQNYHTESGKLKSIMKTAAIIFAVVIAVSMPFMPLISAIAVVALTATWFVVHTKLNHINTQLDNQLSAGLRDRDVELTTAREYATTAERELAAIRAAEREPLNPDGGRQPLEVEHTSEVEEGSDTSNNSILSWFLGIFGLENCFGMTEAPRESSDESPLSASGSNNSSSDSSSDNSGTGEAKTGDQPAPIHAVNFVPPSTSAAAPDSQEGGNTTGGRRRVTHL